MTIADINLEARALVDADSISMPDALLLRRVNQAYEETVGKLIALDTSWNFGDSNFTALPVGTQTMTAGTQLYNFNAAQLTVLRVEVKNVDGLWVELLPILESDIEGGLPEYEKTDGLPVFYAKSENNIILYPAPTAVTTTLTNGLNVYFQRTADIFTSAQVTTGTKTPGFASPYHMILAYKAALPYALSYKKDRVAMISDEINRMENELIKFYSHREKDVEPVMHMQDITFR